MTRDLRKLTWTTIVALTLMLVSVPMLRADHVEDVEEEIAQLRGLNTALLKILGQAQVASADETAIVHGRAAQVIADRAVVLEDLIGSSPQNAESLAFPPDILAQLAAAFPSLASSLEQRGEWQGTMEILVETDTSLEVQQPIQNFIVGNQTFGLFFGGPAPEGLTSGMILTVRGVRAGQRIAAADSSTDGSVAGASATCSITTGDQKIAVLRVTFPGVAFPTNVTRQILVDTFFAGTAPSVNTFWQEVSYGATSATLASGDVFPLDAGSVYTLPDAPATNPYGCDTSVGDYNQIRDAALNLAIDDPDFDLASYDRIFFIHPSPGGSCWYGLGSLGCWGSGTWGTNSYAWQSTSAMTSRGEGTRVSAHEGGHNLDLHHCSSRDFGAEALGAPGVQGSLSEYGDRYCNMGSSSGHYTASQKVDLGWAAMDSGAHQVQTVQSSGVFTIVPAESATPGVMALKVKRGTDNTNSNWLYVEYRQNGGDYDTTTTSAGDNNGAVIHYEDAFTRTQGGRTHLLDFAPSDGWTNVALPSGQSWSDTDSLGNPYSNLSISVSNATSASLDVTVSYGSIPCVESNPTVSMAPSSQSAFAGGSASFTVMVTNNDNSGCSPGSFALSSTIPDGWLGTFLPASLALGNGSSGANVGTSTFTVEPSASESVGSFPVSATATHPNATNFAAAAATVSVQVPLTDIAITSVSAPGSAETGSTVNVAVTVQNSGNQNVGSDIEVTLTDTTDTAAIGTQTIAGGLAAGASVTLNYSWNTTGASIATHTLTAVHDVSDDEIATNDESSTTVSVIEPLSLTSLSPNVVRKGTSVAATISGSGFTSGLSVLFVNGSGPAPGASSVVVVDSTTITATVTAPNGGGKQDRVWSLRVGSVILANALTLSVNAPANATPSVTISSPANGSTFAAGASVTVTGSAADAEDGDLTGGLNWTSSLDGAIGSGSSATWSPSEGTHTITGSVADSGGKTGSSSITITVGNASPVVTISSPSSGTSVTQDDSVLFTGSANDAEDGDLTASLSWTSSLDGAIGTGGSFSTSALSVGTHTITALVTDSGSKSGSDSISVTVNVAGAITLSANGRKVKGKHTIDLTWSGASGGNSDIYRNGARITTTLNDGAYTDATGNKGGGASYTYELCESESGTSTCSNTVIVVY